MDFALFQSIVGVDRPEGVEYLVKMLVQRNLLDFPFRTLVPTPHAMKIEKITSVTGLALTLDGWERYEELKRGSIDGRKAFMAMQYLDEELDEVVAKCFKPAVEKAGFDLILLNDSTRQRAGLIDDRLRVEILSSKFVIADLTHGNRGAYWEAGYAEGLGKPVIYTCKQSVFENAKSRPHFDTNHHLTIVWGEKLDLAGQQLTAAIRATLPAEAKLND